MGVEDQLKSFNALKIMLQEAPILQLPDFNKPFIVTTDASHYCVGGVFVNYGYFYMDD